MSQEEFLRLIAPVGTVLDIRSHPTSKWPQFRHEAMAQWLPAAGKRYEWEPRLGGWTARHADLTAQMLEVGVDLVPYMQGKFPKQRISAHCQDTAPHNKARWYCVGLYDYSWFMSLPEFIEAADALIKRSGALLTQDAQGLSCTENIGILCAETLPWKCHRSMVADFVHFRGGQTLHLQPKPKLHGAMIGNRLERYDDRIKTAWGART
jgi:hypothetical protein